MKLHGLVFVAIISLTQFVYAQTLKIEEFQIPVSPGIHAILSLDGKISKLEFSVAGKISYAYPSGRIDQIGDTKISYAYPTGRIDQIGNTKISYAYPSGRVDQIGDVKISYAYPSGRIDQIGDVKISYAYPSERIDQVGDAKISYSYPTGQISEISNKLPYGLKLSVQIHSE